ncbi:hypothetical protein [Microbulbifer sp. JMSA008]|uniref:hypothetical protein n=1 Tax=Microbulbifer sp. JMSA008 TaxID=3243373 RepID=UPI00403A46C5
MKYIVPLLSLFPLPALAEVSDKMTSIPVMWAQGAVGAIILMFLIRRFIWASVLGFLVVAFFTYASYATFDNPHIGPAIIKEQGTPYIVAAYGSAALMAVGLCWGIFLNRRCCK